MEIKIKIKCIFTEAHRDIVFTNWLLSNLLYFATSVLFTKSVGTGGPRFESRRGHKFFFELISDLIFLSHRFNSWTSDLFLNEDSGAITQEGDTMNLINKRTENR